MYVLTVFAVTNLLLCFVSDAYDASAIETVSRSSTINTPCNASAKQRSVVSEHCADLWLEEMRYRVAVAFQALAWQKAMAQLSKIFGSVSKTERKHRSRLRELLLVFASQRRQQLSAYAAMQTQDLQELVDQQVDQIHPQIEELIRETESRPFADNPCSFMRVEASDFSSLDSPMTSKLLCESKILERKVKDGIGWKTCWNRTLAVHTVDSFVHLFDLSASSPEVSEPDEAFHELILISQMQKLDLDKGLFEDLTPVESVFLPNCTVKTGKKEPQNVEIKEDHVGKRGKIITRKLFLRTGSPEDTAGWMTTLGFKKS